MNISDQRSERRPEAWVTLHPRYLPLSVGLPVAIQFMVYAPLALFNDTASYKALALALRGGEYSQWLDISPPPPDTFRSPGYPLFLTLFPLAENLDWVHRFGQLVLVCIALVLMVGTLRRVGRQPAVPILIVLFGISPQFPFFAAATAPEGLMVFLMAWWIWEATGKNRPLATGLLCGAMALVRPTFLLFPVVFLAASWARNRRAAKRDILSLAIMLLTLLPYGLWNLSNHRVFSLTPIVRRGAERP